MKNYMKNDGKFRYLLVVEQWTENITMNQLPTHLNVMKNYT